MSRFFDLVTGNVRSLPKYTPTTPVSHSRNQGLPNCIHLASNENPFGPSPSAIEAMAAVFKQCNLYPDDDASELRFKLAEHHALPADRVLVTAGSTALLEIIARTLLGPGLNAVTSELTFIVYGMAVQAAGGELIRVPLRNYSFDLDGIAAAVNSQTRLVLIANPNNPTGTVIPADVMDHFIATLPPEIVVIIDEAYYDYAQFLATQSRVHYSQSLDYVRQNRNVVVLRTFSKAHGLAGVRVGYGLGPAELLGYFARLRSTFSISQVAQAAALAAMDDMEHVRKAVMNNYDQARRLAAGMEVLGFRVNPSWANFLYAEIRDDAKALANRLKEEGVLIRSLKAWGAPEAIRVTIGSPKQNEIFLAALRKVTVGSKA
ncbi:MAG TPA: histidinol-phosphate transaminase [Terriglobales bacterium]|nr:histidinol-phosphate transaminase [Terriglobales bacterium]